MNKQYQNKEKKNIETSLKTGKNNTMLTNKYTYEYRLQLKEIILNLPKNACESICTHILIPNGENITVNQSGVLFDLNTISNHSIEQIKQYIDHMRLMNNHL